MDVELVAVDEAVLDELVRAAVTDAAADDVTPPLTTDGSWDESRLVWLREYHRDRRAGLDGAEREATWAVRVDGAVVGAGRLVRVGGGSLELGIWLTRAARGQGVGADVTAELVGRARDAGAVAVVAETTAENHAALGLLRRLGFSTGERRPNGGVSAELDLGQPR